MKAFVDAQRLQHVGRNSAWSVADLLPKGSPGRRRNDTRLLSTGRRRLEPAAVPGSPSPKGATLNDPRWCSWWY